MVCMDCLFFPKSAVVCAQCWLDVAAATGGLLEPGEPGRSEGLKSRWTVKVQGAKGV